MPSERLPKQVKVFVSAVSKKILETGLKDGSTLAERNEAMMERKRKVREYVYCPSDATLSLPCLLPHACKSPEDI